MAVGGAKAIDIIAPTTAANDLCARFVRVLIEHPFPDISCHVEYAERRRPVCITPDRCRQPMTVLCVRRTTGVGTVVGALLCARPWRLVAPWVAPAVVATRGVFPFRVTWKPQLVPLAIGLGIDPTDLDDGMVRIGPTRLARALRIPPSRPFDLTPTIRPHPAPAALFRLRPCSHSRPRTRQKRYGSLPYGRGGRPVSRRAAAGARHPRRAKSQAVPRQPGW